MKDGQWIGHRCFVLGGGPSLRSFDFDLLRGEKVIAVNMAFKYVPKDCDCIAFIRDTRLMKKLLDEKAFDGFEGQIVFHRGEAPPEFVTPFDIGSAGQVWTRSLSEGIVYAANAGLMALHLADLLGADPVYLLGFDMDGDGRKTSNFHDDYPEDWKSNSCVYLERFVPEFQKYKKDIKAEVVNLNPASKLTCFPFLTIAEVVNK